MEFFNAYFLPPLLITFYCNNFTNYSRSFSNEILFKQTFIIHTLVFPLKKLPLRSALTQFSHFSHYTSKIFFHNSHNSHSCENFSMKNFFSMTQRLDFFSNLKRSSKRTEKSKRKVRHKHVYVLFLRKAQTFLLQRNF